VGRVFKKANRRFCEITGYSESELLDQSTRMLYTDEQEFEHVGRNLYSRLELHCIGSIETLWQRKDGKIINVLLNISPLDPIAVRLRHLAT
jgi:PAS domain S-box-containing protein